MKRRIYICMFKQETNSFCPGSMGMEYFQKSILRGADLVHPDGRGGETIRGMREVLNEYGYEAVGGIGMTAQGGGPVTYEVVDFFQHNALSGLRAAGEIAGILLYFHGATLSDRSDDVCGDLLESFRQQAGEAVPIAVACDMHANVTQKVMKNADYICGYVTYPHADFYETGRRSAKLLCRRLSGSPLKTVRATVPVIAPASGYTTADPELRALMEKGCEMVQSGEIADFTIFRAQPWLDVPEIAASVVVTAETVNAAKSAAEILAEGEFALREVLQGASMMSLEEGVRAALENPEDKPVILADSADSSGAGSKGDSAVPLEALLPYRDTLRAAVTVADPAAVKKAFELGVGGRSDFCLGGTLAPHLTDPVLVKDAVVKSLHDGRYIAAGPAERGMTFRIGNCAVLEAGKIQILVMQSGQTERDINFLRGFGIEPTCCRVVCVKACTSFKASYEGVAAKIYPVATPGSAGHILADLPYTRLPTPLYPFQEVCKDDIGAPICFR